MIVRVSSVLRTQEDNNIDNDIEISLKNTILSICFNFINEER